MNNYEGMFLFDPGMLTDWDSVQKEVMRLLDRAEAQLIAISRWDERRLAYDIAGRKRGVYALTYFRCDPKKVTGIERDVQLSESALRCLILRCEYLSEDDMKDIATRSHTEQRQPSPERDRPRRPESEGPGPEAMEAVDALDATEE